MWTHISLFLLFAAVIRPFAAEPEPPRDIAIKDIPTDQLSEIGTGPYGKIALDMSPGKWRHAETENFRRTFLGKLQVVPAWSTRFAYGDQFPSYERFEKRYQAFTN
jgi:hypothetical protein